VHQHCCTASCYRAVACKSLATVQQWLKDLLVYDAIVSDRWRTKQQQS
jgi:hypothetical protein